MVAVQDVIEHIDEGLRKAESLKVHSQWSDLEVHSRSLLHLLDKSLFTSVCSSAANTDIEMASSVCLRRAVILRYLTESLRRQGASYDAHDIALEALSCAKKSRNANEIVLALVNIGLTHKVLGRKDEAIACFQQAFSLAEENKNTEGCARASGNLGTVYSESGNNFEAVRCFEQALELNRSIGRVDGEAIMLMNLGTACMNQSRYIEAFNYFQASLVMEKKLERPEGVAQVFQNLGAVCLETGDYTHALQYYFDALTVAKQIGSKVLQAHANYAIGLVYSTIVDSDKAFEYAKRSLELAEACSLTSLRSSVLTLLASAHQWKQDYEGALPYLHLALDIAIKNNDPVSQGIVLSNLANLLCAMGKTSKAKTYWQQAEQIFESLGNLKELARNHANIGEMFASEQYQMVDLALAKTHLERALKLNEQAKSRQQSLQPLQLLAMIAEGERKWKKVACYYKEMQTIRKELQLNEAAAQAQRMHFEYKIAEIEEGRRLELQVASLKQSELESQVETQKRELDITINMLVNKNNFLHTVSSDLRVIQKMSRAEISALIDAIMEKITKNIASVDTLAALDKQLQSAHSEFLRNLQQLHPSLTHMELKIATLLNLKLSSPNISSLLFLSVRTVELHRSRIRRKMGLNKNDNIYTVLDTIRNQSRN